MRRVVAFVIVPAFALAGSEAWMASDSIVPVFAAVGGAVVAVLAADGVTLFRAFGMVVAGLVLGAYVVPWWAEARGWGDSMKTVSALSCIVGMFGLQSVRVATQQFDSLARAAIRAAAKRAGIDDTGGTPP
jgi:hypothetical protein